MYTYLLSTYLLYCVSHNLSCNTRLCIYIFSPEMGSQAAADALHDAGLSYNDLQAAVASYCYGDPTCGQRALYGMNHLVYKSL